MFTETFGAAWRFRYGTEPPAGAPDLSLFLRHRSVRDFAPDPVPEATAQALFACAQSAATSSNLQLWSAVSVQDPVRREAIAKLCADQKQIRDAAWFFAFLADHARLARAAKIAGTPAAGLDFTEFYTMAAIDAALAAERMACAAESIGLGICYIGALRGDPDGVKALLKLPEGTFGLFGLCIGVPAQGATADIKPRLAQHAMWFREEYDPAPDTAEYDRRIGPWYEAQGAKGSVTWSMRSGRRADGSAQQMGGREGQAGFLKRQGMALR